MATKLTKAQFVENAPVYYALAIANFFVRTGNVAYESDIRNLYIERMFDGETYEYLQKEVIFKKAIEWLIVRDVVEALPDMFGPTIYKKGPRFDEGRDELSNTRGNPFFTYNSISSQENWLQTALVNLNNIFEELEIKETDFEDATDAQWAPIPLERDDKTLAIAIQSLDQLITEIRSDNGYSVTVPEERDLVLDTLGYASEKLKKASHISVPYIRNYILDPIAIVSSRFKDAAISITATAAREAIIEWLKQNAGRLLHYILSGF